MASGRDSKYDAVVVGAGHNGLVAATLLARSGGRVVVLERAAHAGGAAVSAVPFAGVDARISRYAYLVSLFPRALLNELGVDLELRRRRIASYTPAGGAGVIPADFASMLSRVAGRVFGTLTEPLRSRQEFRDLVADASAWEALFEQPLSHLLESSLDSDVTAGTVATDALIGTFASIDDPLLRQNRCFLYHVIGNGTGRWEVPVGGMGALSEALLGAALSAGAEVRMNAPVVAVSAEAARVEVTTADGSTVAGRHLLANVAPSVLAGLIGDPAPDAAAPEGSQLKLNLVLRRLPRMRDKLVTPEDAFIGTFHVNEGYDELRRAYADAIAGRIPELPPCEAYCHSLTDASILGPELRAAGAHTLTVFVLHMPARLFGADHEAAKRAAVEATLRSIDSVLAEPIEDCLFTTPDGEPCIEAHTPLELEADLGLPGGHIFHRDLAWPFAESDNEVGRWGVETARSNVWICGAGARRGGGVSGIPGANAARAVIASDEFRSAVRSP
jgi:phytoene dehydrogenase-like protein